MEGNGQITGACFVFTCFMFAAATAKEFQTLMLARFFAGVFASCPLAVVGGAFSDMFGNETRGIAIAAFSALVFLGPFISPIVGAFITESYLGWRWTEYITGIMGALAFVFDLALMEETYLKTTLQKRAAQIRKATGNIAIHHVSEEEVVEFNDLLHKHFLPPLQLLFREPIVFLITIYTAFIYGILYLFLEAYPIVFTEYRGIPSTLATLPYIGLIVGVLIGCGIVIAFEPRYNRKLKANNNMPVPEQRLLPMMVGATLFPIGLFWFAWTGNYPSIHWIVPTLSGLLTSAGIMTIFLQALNYLIDAYLMVAASAIAANTFLRSFFGAGFPLFAAQMFNNLGLSGPGVCLVSWQWHFGRFRFCLHLWGEVAEDVELCADGYGQEEGWAGE
jgi:DHA1 family multidrug resistance protein-like MFS transporter